MTLPPLGPEAKKADDGLLTRLVTTQKRQARYLASDVVRMRALHDEGDDGTHLSLRR